MKKTAKIYAVLPRTLVQKWTQRKKKQSLSFATRITTNHKDRSHKNSWKICSLEEYGDNIDKPELQYIHDVSEAHYIHRMHPISHFSIYLHSCYI